MLDASLQSARLSTIAKAQVFRYSIFCAALRPASKLGTIQHSGAMFRLNGNSRHHFEMRDAWAALVLLGMIFILQCPSTAQELNNPIWSDHDLNSINSMSLADLKPLLPDRSNRVADDPQAAALGKALFFDPRFSANGAVSCSSCHLPTRQFQDDLRVGHGIADVARRTMPLAGSAYQIFFFWDGRKDSQWSQALGPLESPAEQGADRTMIAQLLAANYRTDFEAVFGKIPELGNLPAHAAPAGSPEAVAAWAALTIEQQHAVNLTFANMGKAIEAFERTIPVPATRYDAYAAALAEKDQAAANKIFTEAERNGLKVFLDQGNCFSCHSGPQFTDMSFHNLGLPGTSAETDNGRITATHTLKDDPFNCLGVYSDQKGPPACQGIRFMHLDKPDQVGAFKSPSLRGVAQRPPYMHNGQFATMHDVMVHYNNAPKAPFGTSELLIPRKLTPQQLADLEAFIQTLNVSDGSAE